MSLVIPSERGEHLSIAWPLQNFRMGSFMPVGRCELQLDRLNSAFGLLYRLEESVAFMAQLPDNDEPVFFNSCSALAACHRPNGTCKKITVLLRNGQIDLEFEHFRDAQNFVATLKSTATNAFCVFEMPQNVAFQRKDFDMAKSGYCGINIDDWKALDPLAGLNNELWKSGDWSDLVVTAGGKSFNVHKSILCPRAAFFANACKSGFAESVSNIINLEEDAETIEAMLAEIYGADHVATASLFASFALEPNIKKEYIMGILLGLFIASDKYNLDSIQLRAAEAFIDRMQFIHDPVLIVGLATWVFDLCPENDKGLRTAVMEYVMARLPAIHGDRYARQELYKNIIVLTELHERFSSLIANGTLIIATKWSGSSATSPPFLARNRKTSCAATVVEGAVPK